MIFAFLIQCAVSFVSVVAFAVLFHAPRQEWAWCGLTGMAGWAAYWLLVQMEQGVVAASLVAAVALALLSRILAVVRRCPMTVFIMGGIFPLVPGAGIYYTVYYFIMGEEGQCLAKGVETLKIAAAIAIGIVLVLALPGALFRPLGCRSRKTR